MPDPYGQPFDQFDFTQNPWEPSLDDPAQKRFMADFESDPLSQATGMSLYRQQVQEANAKKTQADESAITSEFADDPLAAATALSLHRTRNRIKGQLEYRQAAADEPERQRQLDAKARAADVTGISLFDEPIQAANRAGGTAVSLASRLGELVTPTGLPVGRQAADEANRLSNEWGAAQEINRQDDWSPWLSRMYGNIAQSGIEMLATPGGQTAKIIGGGLTTGNRAVTEGYDSGLRGPDLARYVAEQAAPEMLVGGFLNKMGLGGAESVAAGKLSAQSFKQLQREFIKQGLAEGLEEGTTQALQDLSNKLNTQPDLTIEQALTNIAEAAVSGVGLTGALTIPKAIGVARTPKQLRDEADAADRAERLARQQQSPGEQLAIPPVSITADDKLDVKTADPAEWAANNPKRAVALASRYAERAAEDKEVTNGDWTAIGYPRAKLRGSDKDKQQFAAAVATHLAAPLAPSTPADSLPPGSLPGSDPEASSTGKVATPTVQAPVSIDPTTPTIEGSVIQNEDEQKRLRQAEQQGQAAQAAEKRARLLAAVPEGASGGSRIVEGREAARQADMDARRPLPMPPSVPARTPPAPEAVMDVPTVSETSTRGIDAAAGLQDATTQTAAASTEAEINSALERADSFSRRLTAIDETTWSFIDRKTGEIAYTTDQRSVAAKINWNKYGLLGEAERLAAINDVSDDGGVNQNVLQHQRQLVNQGEPNRAIGQSETETYHASGSPRPAVRQEGGSADEGGQRVPTVGSAAAAAGVRGTPEQAKEVAKGSKWNRLNADGETELSPNGNPVVATVTAVKDGEVYAGRGAEPLNEFLASHTPAEGPSVMKVSQLSVDPQRFQYKLNTDKSGVAKQFGDVEEFTPLFAGVLHVWFDPADQKTYVVNGHHRYELAKRAGFEGDLRVFQINAPNAQLARAYGAVVNIAERNGTSVDAAKFLRDTDLTMTDLARLGISPSGQMAKEATALARLSPGLFDRLTQGLFDNNRAIAIATHVAKPEDQERLAKHIEQYEERTNREATDGAVEQMAKKMSLAGKRTHIVKDLFGEEEVEDSTFVERAELEAGVRRGIAESINKFRAVSTQKAAKTLEGANVIDAASNKAEADRLSQLLEDFDRETKYSGPVSEAFNEAARRLADAPSKRSQIIKELGISIPALLQDTTRREGSVSGTGSQSGEVRAEARQEAEAGKPEPAAKPEVAAVTAGEAEAVAEKPEKKGRVRKDQAEPAPPKSANLDALVADLDAALDTETLKQEPAVAQAQPMPVVDAIVNLINGAVDQGLDQFKDFVSYLAGKIGPAKTMRASDRIEAAWADAATKTDISPAGSVKAVLDEMPLSPGDSSEQREYSVENLEWAFNLKPDQAEAVDAIVQSMKVDTKRLKLGKGGDGKGHLQNEGQSKPPKPPKGSFNVIEAGKMLASGLTDPDVSTALHEIWHAAEEMLLNRETAEEFRGDITDEDIAVYESETGLDKAETPDQIRKAKEYGARAWEKWLRGGGGASSKLADVFQKVADWMTDIYRTIKGSPLERIRISPELAAFFDKFTGGTPASEAAMPEVRATHADVAAANKARKALLKKTEQEQTVAALQTPWLFRPDEYDALRGPAEDERPDVYRDQHRDDVNAAILAGDAIPDAVRADYPDIETPEEKAAMVTETALAMRVADAERKRLKLPPALPAIQREFSSTWAKVLLETKENPTLIDDTILDLQTRPHTASDREALILLYGKLQNQNRLNALSAQMIKVRELGNEMAWDTLKIDADRQLQRHTELLDIIKKSGSEAGRSLAVFRQLAKEDYSLGTMLVRMTQSNDGKPLSKADRDFIEALQKKIAEQDKEIDRLTKELEAQQKADGLADTVERAKKKGAQPGRTKKAAPKGRPPVESAKAAVLDHVKAAIARAEAEGVTLFQDENLSAADDVRKSFVELAELLASEGVADGRAFAKRVQGMKVLGDKFSTYKPALMDAWRTYRRANPMIPEVEQFDASNVHEINDIVDALVYSLVESGLEDRKGLVAGVHEALSPYMPGLTETRVEQMIAHYGQYERLQHDPTRDKVRDLRGQLLALSQLNDLEAGRMALKTGKERQAADAEQQRLRKLYREKLKQGGFTSVDEEVELTSLLATEQTRIKNLMIEMEQELNPPEGVPPTQRKRTPKQWTAEEEAELAPLRAALEELRTVYQQVFQKPKKARVPKTEAQRLQDAKDATIKRQEALASQIRKLQRDKKEGRSPVQADQELQRLLVEEKMLDDFLDKYVPEDADQHADAKRLAAIEKDLTNDIIKLNDQINAGRRTIESKATRDVPDTPRIQQLRAIRDAKQGILDTIDPPAELSDAEKAQRLERQLDAMIDRGERELQELSLKAAIGGKLDKTAKPDPIRNAEIDRKRERLARMRQQKKLLRDAIDPWAALRRGIERQHNYWQAKLDSGDFAPQPKRERGTLPDDLLKQQQAALALRQEFETRRTLKEREHMNVFKRTASVLYDAFHLPKDLITTLDMGFTLLQLGSFAMTGRLPTTYRILKEAIGVALSKDDGLALMRANAGIADMPNYKNGTYKRCGWDFSVESQEKTRMEELLLSSLSQKIPGLGRLIRRVANAGNAALNLNRAAYIEIMLNSVPMNKGMITDAEARSIGAAVDVWTGRGDLDKFREFVTVGGGLVMFAPQWTASRLQAAVGWDIGQAAYRSGSARVTTAIAIEKARQLAGLYAASFALKVVYNALLKGDDEEPAELVIDPLAPHHGELVFDGGKASLALSTDPAYTAFLAQTIWGKRVAGERVPIMQTHGGVKEHIARFGWSKLSPPLGMALKLAIGKDPQGRAYSVGSFGEVWQQAQEGGGVIGSNLPMTGGNIGGIVADTELSPQLKSIMSTASFAGGKSTVYGNKAVERLVATEREYEALANLHKATLEAKDEASAKRIKGKMVERYAAHMAYQPIGELKKKRDKLMATPGRTEAQTKELADLNSRMADLSEAFVEKGVLPTKTQTSVAVHSGSRMSTDPRGKKEDPVKAENDFPIEASRKLMTEMYPNPLDRAEAFLKAYDDTHGKPPREFVNDKGVHPQQDFKNPFADDPQDHYINLRRKAVKDDLVRLGVTEWSKAFNEHYRKNRKANTITLEQQKAEKKAQAAKTLAENEAAK